MPISKIDHARACELIAQRIARREAGYIVTPNVDHVCRFHRDADFRQAYQQAFLLLPDGTPIVWASRLFGTPLPQKVSGSDLVPNLCALAEERGFSVFFLGGSPGAAEESATVLLKIHPRLRIAGIHCPPYGFEHEPEASRRAVEAVREASPDICLVALGSPKQELWMQRHHEESGAIVCIGVGAVFEFISRRVRRAPRWVQVRGGEWLWRLAQEPRRLWRRYLVDDLVFFRILWDEYRKQRAAAQRAHTSG